tara:strand:+ start:1418 stop:1555 length:138 start_codon:yes stop_codon:yes gene_type:complete
VVNIECVRGRRERVEGENVVEVVLEIKKVRNAERRERVGKRKKEK